MNEPTTIAQALAHAKKTVSSLDAEVLLAHTLGVTRAVLFAYPEKPLAIDAYNQFQKQLSACAAGIPVAYLTGVREFWSMTLRVTPDTLIPRPETECLVEQVLSCISSERAVIADCGTGSGAIALALASEKPDWQIHAVDCSEKALSIAKENAKQLSLKNILFHHGDWCAALPKQLFNAIVSNPPYLSETDPHLMGLRFEPMMALCSGADGLQAIRILVESAGEYLIDGGWLFIEHGSEQGKSVQNLFTRSGFTNVSITRDYAGLDRVTAGQLSK